MASAQSQREWRKANPEKARAADARYRARHRAKRNAKNKQWCTENRAKRRATTKRWKAANPEKVRARKARYRERHRPEMRAYFAKYRAENPDAIKSYQTTRRARKRNGAVGDRQACAAFIRHARSARTIRCYWCGGKTRKSERHVDHIIPLSRGGVHASGNLCVAHPMCNLRKGNKMPEEFAGQAELRLE